MTKRALSAVAGFVSCCFPLSAQQTDRPDLFSALNNSLLRLPSLSLSDGQLFSFSGAVAPAFSFDWIEATPPNFLRALSAEEPPGIHPVAMPVRDAGNKVVDVQPKVFDYAGGEMGVLYGRSTGKYGRELEQAYIFGEVGNDKFHITAGAFYEESSERVPRRGH